ncbi:uncharacterized protein LOC127852612 isoform X2 [Dreissena polymorpha]|nr:uncharacterized protein LOC127852612 isoform X2 [Dreissena polymorpha]XP_052242541.1 uncharacterized protein LOC127852612 isoform X2 [Dreissena polymorpha]XP_052242548.1 uncharacterized protein LOC127852612 isoform X2 [Dreissena polymorpha]
MKVLKWVPISASQPTSQKMFGKKIAHTSKNRVGRILKDHSNGEDSNQGSLDIDESTRHSQGSDSGSGNLLNEDSNMSFPDLKNTEDDSNDTNMSAALKLVRNENEDESYDSMDNGSPVKRLKTDDKSSS